MARRHGLDWPLINASSLLSASAELLVVVWRITRENRFRRLGCRLLEEPGKKRSRVNIFWCAISRIRGKETPWGIVTKFCTSVDIHDVIKCATFCDDRLRGLGVARGRIFRFPIDLRRPPYNTVALPCECVIWSGVIKLPAVIQIIFMQPTCHKSISLTSLQHSVSTFSLFCQESSVVEQVFGILSVFLPFSVLSCSFEWNITIIISQIK